jgi:diguanylate cyclase (GGDEF)-like protein
MRIAPPAHRLRPGSPPEAAVRDWDVPFGVLEARLGSMAGEPECMVALDQLRTALAHELGRCQQLELAVFDAQTALAQLRVDLAGTRAGERRARHLAMHDGLTSLPNRSFFRQQLGLALAHLEPRRPAFAVLYLDLDGFKPINDTHGHTIGDELLRIVAARLSQAVRAEDMVSRVGGDEFACLMADLRDREQLSRLAVKLVDAVSAPLMIGRLKLSVRPSIGIAVCPNDGTTADALLEKADAAMYRAKRHRTGYAFVD